LALAHVTRATDLLHQAGDSQAGFGGGIHGVAFNRNRAGPNRFLDIQGSVAS
jgi:hypothetical protein